VFERRTFAERVWPAPEISNKYVDAETGAAIPLPMGPSAAHEAWAGVIVAGVTAALRLGLAMLACHLLIQPQANLGKATL
jgi:hypothetical protein